jgi:hypothetical protein
VQKVAGSSLSSGRKSTSFWLAVERVFHGEREQYVSNLLRLHMVAYESYKK